MNWTKVTITTTSAGVEPATGVLLGLGISGFQVEDPADFQEFLTLRNKTWNYMDDSLMHLAEGDTHVIFYIAENAQGAETLALVRSEMKALKSRDAEGAFGPLTVQLDHVAEVDWARNWKQYFKPFAIGSHILVKPTWEEATPEPGQVLIEIDPGASFGTGQHDTTQLCMEQLEKVDVTDQYILDMGCGSGILSIAACKMGAKKVIGVDNDENSVNISIENLRHSGMGPDRYEGYFGDVIYDEALRKQLEGPYDIILANIVADIIIAMKETLYGYLKEGGTIIFSGIINTRSEEVLQEIKAAGFQVVATNEKNDWLAITCTK